MIKLFVCQHCGTLLFSDNWNKYHCKENSCPICNGDMCGCNYCIYNAIIEKTPLTYIDINNEPHKCNSPKNGAFECLKIINAKDLFCDEGCIYYD